MFINLGMTEQTFYWCVKVIRQNQKSLGHGGGSLEKVIDQSIRDLRVSPTNPGGNEGNLSPF